MVEIAVHTRSQTLWWSWIENHTEVSSKTSGMNTNQQEFSLSLLRWISFWIGSSKKNVKTKINQQKKLMQVERKLILPLGSLIPFCWFYSSTCSFHFQFRSHKIVEEACRRRNEMKNNPNCTMILPKLHFIRLLFPRSSIHCQSFFHLFIYFSHFAPFHCFTQFSMYLELLTCDLVECFFLLFYRYLNSLNCPKDRTEKK